MSFILLLLLLLLYTIVTARILNDESFHSNPYDEYFQLSFKYWGEHGGKATECLKYAHQYGWDFPDTFNFYTVGLEGAGHHLINSMPSSIPGNHGYLRSYSWCGLCPSHKTTAWRLYEAATGRNDHLKNINETKFLIIIRDPVDSFLSALRRFWHPGIHSIDTLQREYDELLNSMKVMNEEINQLSCERSLFISYELLINYPKQHFLLFSKFLNINDTTTTTTTTHEGLIEWFQSIKNPFHDVHFNDTTMNQVRNVIGPYQVKCNEPTLLKRLEKFSWPKEIIKNCTIKEGNCLKEFRNQITYQFHNEIFKSNLSSIIPQYPMSYCA